ncbi:sigma-54 dependent transcriptional regulator [Colwellia sp. 1_MG-2023]|uniref:sigma-54-dependent transcriptional regulator n=1 Tax=Colwellia sp. 1_MG-2023 TaxID=3062649 RepID=UPI0026E35FCB|nr:sigma-54 dependent transcriptional regulator [Colwellia sp. 1_MG-2023]MDO6445868.1 sigma-54 dependent transcriptional regulator [Colwellia sp. 1_MG-2023]
MKENGRILIVDDDDDILTAGKLLLKRKFSHISTCNLPEHIPAFISDQDFDVILLDMNFGPGESTGKQGFYWLKRILEIKPDSIIIMITAHGGIDVAVEAMKLGATDFIAKPWQNEKVIATLSTAIQLGQTRTEAQALRQKNTLLIEANNQVNQPLLIGNSTALANVKSLIERSAPTDANILILGENGTGKELVAREIHQQSLRANHIFMSVDLGAISENLFESELFGHKKGAFTGAQHDRIGRLKAADGGTLFLDEIGNLPLHLQAKLLTVLEQREVTPLGENKAIAFDVRVVCATNLAKDKLQNDSIFRQDLLFRLNTVEINLPPLRDRIDDIKPISEYFIQLYGKKYHKPNLVISEATIKRLQQEQWLGNIRALRHAIERAVILTDGLTLTLNDFQLSNTSHTSSNHTESLTIEKVEKNQPAQGELNLEHIEKQTIHQALKKHRYNISHSAKELGLTRAALYRRMEKHGL